MAKRQSFLPGYGYIVEEDDEESFLPGYGYVKEDQADAPAAGGPKGPLGHPLHGPFGGPV